MKSFGRRSSEDLAAEMAAEQAAAQKMMSVGELPKVSQPELFIRLRTLVLEQLDPTAAAQLPPDQLREQLEPLIHELADRERIQLSAREQRQLAEELTDDMVGFGPLEPLLRDDAITDIMINGPYSIFIELKGHLQQSKVRFRDEAHVAAVAQKMAAAIGRRVDESSPLCDARLADGSRVNIVFPPLAIDGACISIRKFSKRKIDFDRMVENGSMARPIARLMEIAARCRMNVVVSGGTGSGKTTLLNAMSQLIDHGERVVTIEDAAELQLQQPHVVRLETRPPNLEGRGEITQRDLLRNALRMRPDRIILGEVRGPEAFDMLQAMNTGHDGSICTLHSNNARDALTRVENLVMMGNFGLPVRGIRAQIAAAIDLVVYLERMRDGVRRVTQISDVCGLEGDIITMNDIASFEFEGEDQHGKIHGNYRRLMSRPSFRRNLDYFGLEKAWMDALESI